MGFGLLMRENLPDFPLHLSTQASVYDLRGVEAAYRLGYERVVLARGAFSLRKSAGSAARHRQKSKCSFTALCASAIRDSVR